MQRILLVLCGLMIMHILCAQSSCLIVDKPGHAGKLKIAEGCTLSLKLRCSDTCLINRKIIHITDDSLTIAGSDGMLPGDFNMYKIAKKYCFSTQDSVREICIADIEIIGYSKYDNKQGFLPLVSKSFISAGGGLVVVGIVLLTNAEDPAILFAGLVSMAASLPMFAVGGTAYVFSQKDKLYPRTCWQYEVLHVAQKKATYDID